MNIFRTYDKFLDRVNALGSGMGQHIGGLRAFVDCFNEAQLSLMKDILSADETDDNLSEYLAPLLKDVEPIGIVFDSHYRYSLPSDFEHVKDIFVVGTKKDCRVSLTVRQRRVGEVSSLLNDVLYRPNLDYAETFSSLHNDHIRVYRYSFDLSDFMLTYYRKPTLVDIEGYTDSSGTPSTNIDPDFNGRFLEMILDRAARIHFRNTNPERAQLFN